MLYLGLAVLCSLSIGMIFKWTEARRLDRIALLTVNYLTAAITAVVLLSVNGAFIEGQFAPSTGLIGLGVGVGVLFIGGFFMLAWATQVAGMGLAMSAMRISVVLPVAASWLVWNEALGTIQVVGLLLALTAFLLIARRPAPAVAGQESPWKAFLVLTVLFFVGGVVDVCNKFFQEAYSEEASEALYLLFVFGVAFFVGLGLVLGKGIRTGRWPGFEVVGIGVVLGVVNYGSAEFLLRALGQLPGSFVFPANNVAIVIGGALLGVFVWRELLSRWNWLGIALAALALALLRG